MKQRSDIHFLKHHWSKKFKN